MLERYIQSILHWHKIIVPFIVVVATVIGSGVDKLTVDHDVRNFLNPNDEILRTYEDFQKDYGSDNNFFVVVAPGSGSVFDPEALLLLHEIGLAARGIPYFSSVTSMLENPIFAMPLARAALEASERADAPRSLEPVEQFREAIMQDPWLAKRLVALDGRAAAVKIGIDLPAGAPEARADAIREARAVVKRFSTAYPNASITLAGNIAVTEELSEAISNSVSTVTTVTSVLIWVFLLIFTRSIFATTATFLVMALSVGTTMGMVGWLGVELTVVAGFVPAAIATLAVADSIHLLVGYHAALGREGTKLAALRAAVRANSKPIFLTSLTSVLGVLTLNFSDAPLYREMGNIIAGGIAVAYLMSMTLWPALMAWFPAPARTPRMLDVRLMSRVGSWVISKRTPLILIGLSVSMLVVSLAARNSFTERWYEYLSDEYEARRAMDTVVENFAGIHHLYYSLDSGQPDGVFDSSYLSELEEFANWYRQQPDVNHVVGLVDALRTAGIVEDSESQQTAGVSVRPGLGMLIRAAGLQLHRPDSAGILNADYSSSILEVILEPVDSASLIALDARAHEWLAENAIHVDSATGLGLDLVFAKINVSNVRSIMLGATIALIAISAMLVLLLRSPRLGLISLVPNLVPIGLAFGVWGIFVGYIDMAVSVVMGISIGLVVDDTVHFLCKYTAARGLAEGDNLKALEAAFGQVGTAIVISSLVLMVGFAGALGSDITPTRETAAILIMTIGFAMLADLLLLPALLAVLDKRP
jgi:predicted RND superfamily exporter protein